MVDGHPFLDARIFKKEAKSLQKHGYDVTMIVPRVKGTLFNVDGTPFKSRFMNKVFTHEGIKIVTYNREQAIPKLVKVYEDPAHWYNGGFINILTQLAVKEQADIYHAHEYMSLFAAVGVKQLMKKKFHKEVKLIYDSHELIPDPLSNKPAKKLQLMKERLLTMLQDVDYIVTVSDSIKEWYKAHCQDVPIEVIYNSPPLQKAVPHVYKKGLTLLYEGNINSNKGNLNKMFEIARICKKKVDFSVIILGGARHGEALSIPKDLRDIIKPAGWVDYQKISEYMQQADLSWIDFANLDQSLNRRYAMPNKFFSSLANGVPVIVNKCDDMEAFLTKYKCGVVLDKEEASAEDYANELLKLAKNKDQLEKMSRNARSIMQKYYSWEKMEQKLFKVYQTFQA